MDLLANIMMLVINLHRVDAGMPILAISEETCAYAQYRLDNWEFSHRGFLAQEGPMTPGSWGENLGLHIGPQEPHVKAQRIVQLWKESPTHNQNLLADVDSMCIKTDGVNYVLITHGEKDATNNNREYLRWGERFSKFLQGWSVYAVFRN